MEKSRIEVLYSKRNMYHPIVKNIRDILKFRHFAIRKNQKQKETLKSNEINIATTQKSSKLIIKKNKNKKKY